MDVMTVRTLRRGAILLALALASGCYTFAPARMQDARPDQSVRVRLAPAGAVRLADFADPETRSVQGKMVELSGDSLLLLVPSHTELRGTRVETLFQRIQIGQEEVLELELRNLDRPRTYLVTGMVALAVGAFALDRLSGKGGSEVVTPGGGPNDALIPSVRIPFRIWSLIGR